MSTLLWALQASEPATATQRLVASLIVLGVIGMIVAIMVTRKHNPVVDPRGDIATRLEAAKHQAELDAIEKEARQERERQEARDRGLNG